MAHKVSIIITILNEESTLPDLLLGLSKQTLKPSEIIIVDGGSTDKSLAILEKNKLNLRIFSCPGSRAKCRNFGVSKSKSKIIAFTDAGCIPKPDWLEKLTEPFTDTKTSVVSGYYKGSYANDFEKCLIPYVLVMPDKIPVEFLPSTRSMAILKKVFLDTNGFDETLYHNEDYAYAVRLSNLGYKFVFAKDAVVVWLPRKTLRSAAWMFFRFALGDIQAGIFRPKLKYLAIRYLAGIYLFFLTLEIPILFPILVILILTYLIWSILKNFRHVKTAKALFWLPIIQITSDLSVLFGTLVGIMYKIALR